MQTDANRCDFEVLRSLGMLLRMTEYEARRFTLPEQIVDLAEARLASANKADRTLTPVAHEPDLGDYSVALAWYKTLQREHNWVGATMLFNLVYDHFRKEQAGNNHFQQFMIAEVESGADVGYLRLHHLSRDTETRRSDCTKIEETIVSDAYDLRDPALFRFMYDHAAEQSLALDHRRIVTELGVGFSGQKYRSIARRMAQLQKSETAEDAVQLARLEDQFNRDWVGITVSFVREMKLSITDVVVPNDTDGESTPQIRISRRLKRSALPLPPYIAKNRVCEPYQNRGSLKLVRDWLAEARDGAAKRYL